VVHAGDTEVLVEAKWRAAGAADRSALAQLRDHAARTPPRGAARRRLCVASGGGFADRLRQLAALEDVILLGPAELFGER
jgi:hypothetical protein